MVAARSPGGGWDEPHGGRAHCEAAGPAAKAEEAGQPCGVVDDEDAARSSSRIRFAAAPAREAARSCCSRTAAGADGSKVAAGPGGRGAAAAGSATGVADGVRMGRMAEQGAGPSSAKGLARMRVRALGREQAPEQAQRTGMAPEPAVERAVRGGAEEGRASSGRAAVAAAAARSDAAGQRNVHEGRNGTEALAPGRARSTDGRRERA